MTAEPETADVLDVEGIEDTDPPPATTTAALATIAPSALMRPVASRAETVQAFRDYQELRNELLDPSDFQSAERGKSFVTKSGWRKLAVAMGVSDSLVSRDYDRDAEGRIVRAEVIARAVAPNGRYAEALGICDAKEKCKAGCKMAGGEPCDGFRHFSKPQHDIPSTAHTRAKNRALSDLFGFGEVTAEEVTDAHRDPVEPADGADVEALEAAMNAIADPAQKRGTKLAFVQKFGLPHTLTTANLEAARRFVTAAGATIPDTVTGGASEGADPGTAPDPEVSGAGDEGEGRRSHVSATPTSSPADSPEPDDAPPRASGDVDGPGKVGGAASPPRAVPPTPSAPPVPSTTAQRREVGVLARTLAEQNKIAQGDKAELVAIVTQDEARTSMVDTTREEAAKVMAALRLIETGDLQMVDGETDGERCLAGVQPRGVDFLHRAGLA